MSESNLTETLQEEIKMIKGQMMGMMNIVQDFKDLKLRRKISGDALGFSAVLMMVIKEELLKEVNMINFNLRDQINELKEVVEINKQETLDKFEGFQGSLLGLDEILSETNENISNIRGHVNKFYDKFDDIRKNFDEKAALTDLNEVKLKCKQFAFQSQVDLMTQELSLKAPRESFDKLHRKVVDFEDTLPSFIKKYEVDEIKTGVKYDIESYLDLNFMLQEDFLTYKDIVHAKHQKFEDDFKGLIHKVESNNKLTKDHLARFSQKLTKKPWKKDVERLDREITSLAKITELKDLEYSIFPALYLCQETVKKYGDKIDEFERILTRYDEILLEKASKDDVKFYSEKLKSFLKSDDFEEFHILYEQQVKDQKYHISEISSQISSINSLMSSHSSKLDRIKKETKETSHVASQLQSIRDDLMQKADKIDFHAVMDMMGRKEDLEKVTEKCEVFQKQFELSSILNFTLCRTLLGSGESTSSLVQQRQDVFRKMQNLVSWVNGDEPRVKSTVPWRVTPTVRQELFLSKEESLKQIPRTARNGTARIKMRPKRFTPRLEFASLDASHNFGNTVL
jgi:uncharacterized coiled-coil protein SlyX